MTYPKEKNKRKWFFFFLKNLDTPRVHMQKYPRSTSTQKVFGTGIAPFLEYSYFIVLSFISLLSKHMEHLNCMVFCRKKKKSLAFETRYTYASRHEHKLFSLRGVNVSELLDNWFWWVESVVSRLYCLKVTSNEVVAYITTTPKKQKKSLFLTSSYVFLSK